MIGTATSGQAARTLGREAGIESRTTRSLLWRLDHGQLTLTDRTMLVLAWECQEVVTVRRGVGSSVRRLGRLSRPHDFAQETT